MSSPGITKKAIADAMKKLMAERPLAKVNVGDIVDICGLNRNSFYYHFKDKYDLVNWIFYTDIAEEFKKEEVESVSAWKLIERLCQFFYRDKKFYINALSVSGQNSFEEYFLELVRKLIVTRVPDILDESAETDFFIDFFVDAFSVTILKWLRKGVKMTPDELVTLIKKATTGAASRILNDTEQ